MNRICEAARLAVEPPMEAAHPASNEPGTAGAGTSTFDVDAACARLQRRARLLLWGLLLLALLCAGLGHALVEPARLLLGDPLHPVLSEVHIPAAALHAGASFERTTTVGERALSYSSIVIVLGVVLVARRAERSTKLLAFGVGGGLLGLILIAQFALREDTYVNRDLKALADDGRYAELAQRAHARHTPYAEYMAAQALVLAGGAASLRAEHGAWLSSWSEQAVRLGYAAGDREVPPSLRWEGVYASPAVMRALETIAFGAQPSAFAERYEQQTQAALASAQQQLGWLVPPAGLAASLLMAGLIVHWRLRVNLRAIEKWLVRFDYYEPEAVEQPSHSATGAPSRRASIDAAAGPVSLPPLDFAESAALLTPQADGQSAR